MTYVLLTRAPLYWGRSPFSRDLHVLGAPLTFVLSQDQTLQFESFGERELSKPLALPLCSLSSNTHSAVPRNGETSLVTYYEDPRRFSSRVIGLSFQGPRGRAFLPSGSRYLVSAVFAVKDFVKLFFRVPDCFPFEAARLRVASRRPGGSESGGGVCLPSFRSARPFVDISFGVSF